MLHLGEEVSAKLQLAQQGIIPWHILAGYFHVITLPNACSSGLHQAVLVGWRCSEVSRI